jgi:hypothetical protein
MTHSHSSSSFFPPIVSQNQGFSFSGDDRTPRSEGTGRDSIPSPRIADQSCSKDDSSTHGSPDTVPSPQPMGDNSPSILNSPRPENEQDAKGTDPSQYNTYSCSCSVFYSISHIFLLFVLILDAGDRDRDRDRNRGRGSRRGSLQRSGSDLVGFYDGLDDTMWSKSSHSKRGSNETCEQRESEGEEGGEHNQEQEEESADVFGDSVVMNMSSASVSTNNTSSTIYGSLLRR